MQSGVGVVQHDRIAISGVTFTVLTVTLDCSKKGRQSAKCQSFLAAQPPIPSTGAPFGLSKLFGSNSSSAPGVPGTPSPVKSPAALKPIKTPHNEPISHPELAFSPSDIGVWEINKSELTSHLQSLLAITC